MKTLDFAITPNLKQYLPPTAKPEKYEDIAEHRTIYKVSLTNPQYKKLWDIGENIGGWVVRFNPNLSRRV